ncbi:class I SAM-dependent methyltransferase [Paractinoplanes globisporus]|uniref:Class I SAM-dependent methyltransferase n=1 Tax=Paractinoplanes globisporus TaxID=113565 RepID=A0ABW6W7S5_9ACTN|nr:methyltransferase domain-containing protein [Actinoplanes globisporus]
MGTQVDPDAFNAFEAAGWEKRAPTYHRLLLPITRQVVEPLLDAAAVGPGSRVLDVGSGPGYVAAAAFTRGASAVGVDVAPAMVALARTLHPSVEFVDGDAEHLQFADDSFDVVVANFAILHLGRPEQAAAEFARVLAPGGKVALSTWDVPAASRMPGVFYDAVQEVGAAPPPDLPTGPPFYRFADEAEFVGLLNAAGFVDASVSTVAFTYHYVGDLFDALVGGTVRTRSLVITQPEATQARIRAALDRLTAEYAADGGFDLPTSVKVASATAK